MSKQPAPAPAIAPRQSAGAHVARVTGAASPGEMPPQTSVHSQPRANAGGEVKAIQLGGGEAKVVKWGNGGRVGSEEPDDLPPSAMLDDKTGGVEGAAVDGPAAVAAAGAEGEDEAAKVAAAAVKPTPADRRSSALANLEAERKSRELEQTLKTVQGRAARADDLEKTLREGSLGDRLKLLGIPHEDLLEKLLVKDKSLGESPAKETPEASALKKLEEKIATLEKQLEGRGSDEGQAQIQRAVASIAEQLKTAELPLTNSMAEGHHLVLQVAHQMWLDSGKNGHPKDYVVRAGTNVEGHLREKNPGLAKMADATKKAGGAAPAAGAGGAEEDGARSLGKRSGKGAPGGASKLSRDRDVRDQEIKREMGW